MRRILSPPAHLIHPPLPGSHHHRPPSYNAGDYHNEVASLISAMEANPNIPRVKNMLVGPSLGGFWPLDSVWKTKFLDVFREEIGIIAVERCVGLLYFLRLWDVIRAVE